MSRSLLFAALEAKGTAYPYEWNTVAIAGLDGYAKAQASFAPIARPWVGCAGPVLPRSAYIAAGKAFFADGTGAIRTLAPGGQPTPVTSFPVTSNQQMLSFSVSPDGSQLVGTIFTLPPKAVTTVDPCSSGGAGVFGPGTFTLDVYAARAGAAARLLYHQDLGTFGGPPLQLLAFIGWDALGPLATYPTVWASQGGGPIHYFGTPVRVDATTGKVTRPVSDQSCPVWDIAPTGDYVCIDSSGGASVRRPDGTVIWRVPGSGPAYVLLATDETHLVVLGGPVYGRDGSAVQLPSNFFYSGWLDAATLIGGGYGTNFTYVSLSAPGTQVDIGFTGMFVGTVRS